VKGIGVDCVNFVWAVTSECGLRGADIPSRYARIARYHEIEKYIGEYATETDIFEPSNILLFECSGYRTHIGFGTDIGVIHASLQWGKVVEHAIDGVWARSLVKQWKVFE
jgi:hypothetical protein